jgi:hypothetical protein
MKTRVRRLQLGTWYAVMLVLVEAAVACGSSDKKDATPSRPSAGKGGGGTSSGGKGGSSGKSGTTSVGGKGGKGGAGGSSAMVGGGTGNLGGGEVGGSGNVGGTGMMMNPRCQVLYDYGININDVSVPSSEPSKLHADVDYAQTPDEGAGTPGAVEVTIPFSAEDQLVSVVLTPFQYNLSGLTLSARVKLGKGLTSDEAHPGHARLAVKAGLELVHATGPEVELVEGEWLTLRIDTRNPDTVDKSEDPYDPNNVYEIAVEILSGENAGTKYTTATAFIDDLSICKAMSSGIGGTSGTGGSAGAPMGGRSGAGGSGGDSGAPAEGGAGPSGAGGEGGGA